MANRLDAKVAVVTGTGSYPGIGHAIAIACASEGATVLCTDLDEMGAQACAEEIKREGGKAHFLRHDVSSPSSWGEVLEYTKVELGPLDVLVNNAGIAVLKSLDDLTLDDFRRQLDVNLVGPFIGMRSAIPYMRGTGGGSIVNIVSIAGSIGSPMGIAYGASKGGLWAMSKAVAVECAPDNIRCNTVHPGTIWTNMLAVSTGATAPTEVPFASSVPLKRVGDASDVANAVIYLSSDESCYVTGAEIYVDGGITSQVGLSRPIETAG